MIGSLGNVGKIPDLRKRILFTLGMLAVYRFGVFVSTPGVNVAALREMLNTSAGTVFGMVNMFSGGSLENFSIFTLGIMPYITVSIIIQFLTPVIPALDSLKKEGAAGQRVLTRYTRQATVVLALFQSFFIANGLEAGSLVIAPGMLFKISTMITLTAGTAFIMWLSEQISERGIGNGMSIIIFAGIIARMPQVLVSTLALSRTGELSAIAVLVLLAFCLATIAAIVYVERSHRKVPVHYPRRGGTQEVTPQQHMPLKVNMSGVLPPIFAYAIMFMPATVGNFVQNETVQDLMAYMSPGNPVYYAILIGLILICTFYCTAVVYNPEEVADNLKKNGAFIPTVRPGAETANYLTRVTNRLTFWGAIYIALVCVIPEVVYYKMGVQNFGYVFGGTAILIAVGVTLDTASQIESHMVASNYEAFMGKASKSRGRSGTMSQMRSRVLKR